MKQRTPSQEIRHRLANNLKNLRKVRGYSQKDVARRTGLNKGYVSKVEHERMNVSLANLEALAKGLGCTEEDLVRRPPAAGVLVAIGRRTSV